MPIYPYSFQLPPLNVQDIPNDGAPGEFLGINVGGALDWLPAGGGGSGDMLAANNLSELTNFATARTNIGLGTTSTPTFANLTLTSPSLASSAPVTISQTWGTTGTYTAFKVVATETAVASTVSNLLELWSGSTPTLKVNADKSGNFAVTGTILADSNRSAFRDGGVTIGNAGALQWSQSSTAGATRDLFLVRDAANTLALRNGAAAQTFRVYNTYTDASNYERGGMAWVGGAFHVGVLGTAGTGSPTRALQFVVNNGAAVWNISTAGHFLTNGDNAYDIGASGANRPRNVYVANGLTTGSISPNSGTDLIFNGASTGAAWKITPSGHFHAFADNAYDIGASGANRPRNLYVGSNIYAAGNVGIGTTAPSEKLHVLGGKILVGDPTDITGASVNGELTVQAWRTPQLNLVANAASNNFFGLSLKIGTGERAGFLVNMQSGEVKIGGTGGGGYFPTFYSNGSEVMRLSTTLNVGIGTTSPTSKLHVAGQAFLEVNGSNTAPSLRIGAGANVNGWYSFGGVQLNGVVNSVNVLGIASGGINVAVGNITFGNAADVVLEREAQDELALRRSTNGQKFSVYGTYPGAAWERFTITAPTSGNVLLGTYKGTGGIARGLEFQTDGVTRMSLEASGNNITIQGAITTAVSNQGIIRAGNNTILAASNDGTIRAIKLRGDAGGTLGWAAGADPSGALSIGLMQVSAGVLALGDGTLNSVAGSLNLTNINAVGNVISRPSASITPAANGDLVVEATSNTTLTFKLKGTDGTVRTGTITLA